MHAKKMKFIVWVIAFLMAAVLYFIASIDIKIFFYVACAFGAYGFVSVCEDLYIWLIKETSTKQQAKHISKNVNNIYKEEAYYGQ